MESVISLILVWGTMLLFSILFHWIYPSFGIRKKFFSWVSKSPLSFYIVYFLFWLIFVILLVLWIFFAKDALLFLIVVYLSAFISLYSPTRGNWKIAREISR